MLSESDYPNWINGFPKKEDSWDKVFTVKLCWPLSHLVILLGRSPRH